MTGVAVHRRTRAFDLKRVIRPLLAGLIAAGFGSHAQAVDRLWFGGNGE